MTLISGEGELLDISGDGSLKFLLLDGWNLSSSTVSIFSDVPFADQWCCQHAMSRLSGRRQLSSATATGSELEDDGRDLLNASSQFRGKIVSL